MTTLNPSSPIVACDDWTADLVPGARPGTTA
jgi:hypothetical protein